MKMKMISDEEIDFLVALNIMEYTGCTIEEQLAWIVPTSPITQDVIFQTEWRPSTDIIDAWKVLEKFRVQDYYISVISTKNGWGCKLLPIDKSWGITIFDETAPMAICLAALKAMGINTKAT